MSRSPADHRPKLRLLPLEDRITPDAGDLIRTHPNPQPIADDGFGWAVAVDSQHIVVGAPYVDVNDFPDAGAVYMFKRSTGEQVAFIPNPQPAAFDRYGWSVVLWAGSGWVGAPYDDPGGVADSGSVFSYSVDGGIIHNYRMDNPSPAAGDLFGYSLGTDGRGNYLAVGAPGDDFGAVDAGRAYLGTWTSGVAGGLGRADNPAPHAGDRFGESVAVKVLGQMLIGAPGDDVGATDAGRAFLYDSDAQFAFPIENPNPGANDKFGAAVAVGGNSDIAVIGAPGDTSGGVPNAGAAYAFDVSGYSDAYVSLMNTLPNPNPTDGDRFGAAIAADGLLALIGAPGEAGTGTAYEFRTSTGQLLAQLNNPDPDAADGFGSAVAIGASRGVVGTPFDDPGNVSAAGSAYLFDTNNRPKVTNDTVVVRKNAGPTAVVTIGDDSLLPDWGDFMTVAQVTQGAAGGTVGIATDARSVTYRPPAGFVGTDSFTYTAADGNGGTATAVVTILVSNPPAATGPLATLGPANPDGQFASDAVGVAATATWTVVRPNVGEAIRVYDTATGALVRTLPNPGINLANPIAVSGNRVLVGNDQQNKAYLYDINTGALLHTFQPPSGVILFGISVALDGDNAVVGTYEDYESYASPGPSHPGRVFVFNAVSGALTRTIANPTFNYLEEGFGTAVAVEGDTLVVGAYRAHVAANLPFGQAYVYELGTGNLRLTLNSAVRHYNGLFGAAVAVSGDRIAVGGREQVYLFDRANGNLIANLGDPTYAFTDQFGMSLDLDGNRVLVGALGDDPNGVADAGAAYLYDASSGAFLRSFDNPVPAAGQMYGSSVALAGGRAIVGTWLGNPATGAGAAYLFDTALPPTAVTDLFTVAEDAPATTVNVLANDFAAPGVGGITVTAVTQPAHGTVTLTGGVVKYTPVLNYNGPDAFTYTVTDAAGGTATATVQVTVTAVNDPPTVPDLEFALPELSLPGTLVGTVAATDPDGDTLTYAITAGNTDGAFAMHPVTGRITVANPTALDFETRPTFTLTVRARDPGGLTGTATVTVRLSDVPELPPPPIDIQPGDPDNVVVRGRGALVTVAVLWSSDLDPRLIATNSLRFGRTGWEDSLYQPPAGRPRVWLADVNGDGELDLVAEFEVSKTGFRLGDTKGILTGRTRSGAAFSAEDEVDIR